MQDRQDESTHWFRTKKTGDEVSVVSGFRLGSGRWLQVGAVDFVLAAAVDGVLVEEHDAGLLGHRVVGDHHVDDAFGGGEAGVPAAAAALERAPRRPLRDSG